MPIDFYYNPAFAVVQTAALTAPVAPVVTMIANGSGTFAVKPVYYVIAYLDGGRYFRSSRATGQWAGGTVTSPTKISVQWQAVPYAKAYGVWRVFADQAAITSTKLIYFGSGRNIFSGIPETTDGSALFWGQDFFLWDRIGDNACIDGTKATGRDVALPGTSGTARGDYQLLDCRMVRTGGIPSGTPRAIVNTRVYAGVSDPVEENENDRLVGFSRGGRLRFPVRFNYAAASAEARTVNLIWNAEMARADSDSAAAPTPGLRLVATLAFNGTNLYPTDEWAAPTGWFPVRIVEPKDRAFVPFEMDTVALFDETFVFEAENTTETIPDPEEWASGRPLVL
jgi:hypothetical protein